MNLDKFTTETRNTKTLQLDELSALEIVTLMNQEDATVPLSISHNLDKIAIVAQQANDCFLQGGRLFYLGAGTSGRLGVLDASECPPTFGVSNQLVIGIIAGGEAALRQSVENAEDDETLAQKQLQPYNLNQKDLVVAIAASGKTPYVIGALKYARHIGAKTVSISCNKQAMISQFADIAIEIEVGPEVLTGSTRLKAGTAQKLVLNMITTTAMVLYGKVYQNLMVDLQATNAKLRKRAENIVMQATGQSRDIAQQALKAANQQVKLAILMLLTNSDAQSAEKLLAQHQGHLTNTLRFKEKNL